MEDGMMSKDTGGPAFPTTKNVSSYFHGMTLRDYFAAKAMQGLLAQSDGTAPSSDLDFGAEYAYKMADAMLKARNAE
jgi:hypothetical protein